MVNPALLGWFVLAYTGVTSGTVLGLLRALVTRDISGAVIAALESALWVALLAGGIGLVLHRRWGRRLVLLGAGGFLLASVPTILILRDISAPAFIWAGIGVIPVLVIFLATLRVKRSELAPRVSTPVARLYPEVGTYRGKLDIGYVSFLCVALTILVFAAIELLSAAGVQVSEGTAAGVRFLVLIPLTLFALAANLVGIVFSLIMWRDWRLPVLAVLSVSSVLAWLAYEELGLASYVPASLAVVYVVASVAFSIRWFLFARRRLA